jgi:hypothetical protein
MQLIQGETKTIAFPAKQGHVQFKKGLVVNDQQQELYEYSYSTDPYLGFYRFTLSFASGEIRRMMTFQVQQNENRWHTMPENTTALQIWRSETDVKKPVQKALDLIIHEDFLVHVQPHS